MTEHRSIWSKLYNALTVFLALGSICLVISDLCSVISLSSHPFYGIDLGILLFFWTDYFVRILRSKNKLVFVRENILDLLAILPLNAIFSFFRVFRIFRIMRLTKLFRLIRAASFLGSLRKRLSNFLHTNGFIYVLYTCGILILISSLLMMLLEGQSFGDALWWSIVTCTTVGYGDISPSSATGRVIAVILMLTGIGMIGMLTSSITAYFAQKTAERKGEESLQDLIDQMDDEQKTKVLEIAKIIVKK